MKKLLSIILAILMIVTTMPMAFAADIRLSGSLAGGNGKYELDYDGVLTISGEGSMGSISISSYSSYVNEIIIEDGITNVEANAFAGYSNLTSIYIADSVEEIRSMAFYRCKASKIYIGSGIKTIGNNAFYRDRTSSSDTGVVVVHYNGTQEMWNAVTVDSSNKLNVHYLEKGETVPATCVDPGYSSLVCATCGYNISTDVVPATGEHTRVNDICTVCGDGCVHSYVNGVCTICSIECKHNWMNGYCNNCGLRGGNLSNGLEWKLNLTTGVLTVTGVGAMPTVDASSYSSPLYSIKNQVKTIVVAEGITSIGSYAFGGFSSVTNIVIPSSVKTMDKSATSITTHYCGKAEDLTLINYGSPTIHYCEERAGFDATCTVDGAADGWYCATCAKYVAGGEAIPATGEHTYVNGICACGAECAHEYFNQERIRPVQNADGTWSKGTVKAICTTCGCVFAEKEAERDHEGYAAFEEAVAELEALLNREDLVDGPKTGYTSSLNNLKNVAYSLVYMEDEATMDRIVADVDVYIAAIEAGLADGTMKKADWTYMTALFEEINAIIDNDYHNIIPSMNGYYLGPQGYYNGCSNIPTFTQASYNGNINYEKQLETLLAGLKDGTALKVDGLKFVVEVNAECLNNIVEKYSYDEMDNLYKRLTDEINAELTAITEEAEALTGSVKENEEALADLEARIKAVYEKLDKCLAGVHNGLVYEVTEEAKCGVNAIESATCVVCGDVITREVENSALTHSFTNYIYNEDATCTADGTKTATCDNGCGETDTVTAKDTMLKHADENSDDICDDCGTEIVKTCPDCGRPVHDDTLVQNFVCWIIMLVNLIKSMF